MTNKGSDSTLLALYPGVEEAVRACRSLVDDGFASEALSVLSDVPIPEGVFPVSEPRLPLQWFTLMAGVVGIAAGVGLTVGTSLAYPIRTGHMSIVPIPPYAVVAYELMMLAAILATMGGFALAVLRGRRRNALYDDGVAEDDIGVLVYCEDERVTDRAREVLSQSDPRRIRQASGRHL